MKKILTVLGARPQFVKAGVVSHAISHTHGLKEILVHTGQHSDPNMSDIFFSELGISKPNYFLGIHGLLHGAMTGRMLESLEHTMLTERPDIVLVYGDTNSTLAGALAAAKLHIPVAHVEAGLRSFNMNMPEEVNRVLTDRLSRWLFVPTKTAMTNLIREGLQSENCRMVGDVMFDVALRYGSRAQPKGGLLSKLDLTPQEYILATIHRAENTDSDERLIAIVESIIAMSQRYPVVWPLHPRTRAALVRLDNLDKLTSAAHVIDPVGYLDMVQLEKFAKLVATDSGGVQKEAFFFGVPCVTLRDETEWVELVESGWNRLASPVDAENILETIEKALTAEPLQISPYGEGNTAKLIAATLAA